MKYFTGRPAAGGAAADAADADAPAAVALAQHMAASRSAAASATAAKARRAGPARAHAERLRHLCWSGPSPVSWGPPAVRRRRLMAGAQPRASGRAGAPPARRRARARRARQRGGAAWWWCRPRWLAGRAARTRCRRCGARAPRREACLARAERVLAGIVPGLRALCNRDVTRQPVKRLAHRAAACGPDRTSRSPRQRSASLQSWPAPRWPRRAAPPGRPPPARAHAGSLHAFEVPGHATAGPGAHRLDVVRRRRGRRPGRYAR